MTDPIINKSIFFAAPRETVWAFLTEKDKLSQWFQPAQSDLKANEDYALINTNDAGEVSKIIWGKVLEMDAPSRLVYTFTIKPMGGAMTTVTWQLEQVPGGTKLSLSHAGISAAAGEAAMGLLMALDDGWDKHLASFRSVVS